MACHPTRLWASSPSDKKTVARRLIVSTESLHPAPLWMDASFWHSTRTHCCGNNKWHSNNLILLSSIHSPTMRRVDGNLWEVSWKTLSPRLPLECRLLWKLLRNKSFCLMSFARNLRQSGPLWNILPCVHGLYAAVSFWYDQCRSVGKWDMMVCRGSPENKAVYYKLW